LIINNLSDQIQPISIYLPRTKRIYPRDILNDRRLPALRDNYLGLMLTPYRYLWLKM